VEYGDVTPGTKAGALPSVAASRHRGGQGCDAPDTFD
jgi:hypothetical protein